ncbi:cobalt ECF transporter T component CbiQ [soil metagenome]
MLCCGLLACAVLLPPWPTAGLVLFSCFVAARIAGLPTWHLFRMMRIPMVFIVVAGITTAVSIDPSGPLVSISPESLTRAGEAVARAVAATAAMLLLASTTPMSDLTDSLRRIGMPEACVDVVTVMYRMIFLLLDSIAVVRKSQTARLGYSSASRSIRSAGLLAAAALIKAWKRGHALERGLAGRNLGMPLAKPEKARVSMRFVLCAIAANIVVVLISLLPLLMTTL